MNRLKTMFGITAALLTATFLIVPALKAGNDTWNKRTRMTFSQPFQIPGGQTLPAGSYTFKLLDSTFDREIVQILSADQNHLYATIMAIPNSRLKATTYTVVEFQENESGSPQAIKAWFHPDQRAGHEFVYPKTQAEELAKVTNEPVPSMPDEFVADIATPSVAAMEKAPIEVAEPNGQEVTTAEVFLPLPVEAASLPHTASLLPLIEMAGLLSLAMGFSVRAAAKQRA